MSVWKTEELANRT